MSAPRYHPLFCEENIWHLAGDADPRSWVALITNRDQRVAIWCQKRAATGEPVVWDYHVILFAPGADGWRARDLDSALGDDVDARVYLERCFRPCPPAFAPRFRVLDAPTYRRALRSDRRHMKDAAGRWIAPPPPWPAIGDDHTLPRLLDLDDDLGDLGGEVDGDLGGAVVDLDGLRARLDATGDAS